MKETKKKLFAYVLLVAFVCSVTLTATAISNKKEISLFSDGNLTQDEALAIVSELQEKDLLTLIQEANKLDSSSTAGDKIVYYYEVIKNKLSDTPPERIITALLDTNNTDEVKINILTLCEVEDVAIDYDQLIPLLDDNNTSSALKNVLIDLMAGKGNKYADEIEEHALLCNESNIFKALTTLQALRPKKAEIIADDILSDLNTSFSEKYKAAIITKANILHSKSDRFATNEFISICDNIYNDMSAKDPEEKEITVLYALSLVQSRETFAYLMDKEDDLSKSFRAYIVEENQTVINDILAEKPTTDSVRLLVKTAPYYYPRTVFVEKINTYLSNNAEFFGENQELCSMLLEVIK